MKDIFKPGELKQNIIKVSKKIQVENNIRPGIKTIKGSNGGKGNIKSTLIITNKRLVPSKIILAGLITTFIVLVLTIIYYLFILNKVDNKSIESNIQENSDIDKFEENLDKIESSSKDLDEDSQDIEPPIIDFNANL